MKTKKKDSTSSRFFTRGEKVTGKRGHHGRGSAEKKAEIATYGPAHKEGEEVPTA